MRPEAFLCMLCRYFYSIKNRVKASVLNEQTNCIRLVSLVSATVSLERERVLLEYKIIGTAFNNIDYSRAHFPHKEKKTIRKELSFLEKVFLLWGIAKNYNVLGGLHLEV